MVPSLEGPCGPEQREGGSAELKMVIGICKPSLRWWGLQSCSDWLELLLFGPASSFLLSASFSVLGKSCCREAWRFSRDARGSGGRAALLASHLNLFLSLSEQSHVCGSYAVSERDHLALGHHCLSGLSRKEDRDTLESSSRFQLVD